MDNPLNNSKLQDIPQDVLDYFLDQMMARGGEKLYGGFEQRLQQKQQEAMRAQQQAEQEKHESMRQGWLDEHHDTMKKAFEVDPEYRELALQRKFDQNPDAFESIVNSLVDYKDKAPSMLKHMLRNENILNDLSKINNERDGRYLLNNVFSEVSRENPQQQTNQNQQPDKPVKLPDPQMMAPIDSVGNMDDEIADSISRM